MLMVILTLGILVAVGAARPHDGWQSHDGGHQYDWLSTGGVTHYYYTYPSHYYSYYNYYPYYYSYYESGVEMRPGEATAEWLFYHGIGEPWVGGNPPHSRW